MHFYRHFIILQLLFSLSLCEISADQKEKLLNGFISFYNNLPGQLYKCDEGSLQNADQLDETSYEIVADLKVKELNNLDVIKLFKCTAKLKDSEDGVTVESNHCEDQDQTPAAESQEVPAPQTESTEPLIARSAIKLENEVQSDTAFTSGEQFIAIPRDQPNAHCIGCASHVNPQAAGVSDLANLGIRHLDLHEPSVKHTLNSVLDVERQVQVVNGVRYILTQSVLFNKCGELVSDECTSSKTCRITILVKPWVKLPNGKNYRAILANNCTEEWQYGDNGEVLPELTNDSPGSNDGILVINNKDLQTQPNQQKTLSDEELKLLQEQIIPRSNFEQATARRHDFKTTTTGIENVSKQHVFKLEGNKQSGNSIPVTESVKNINQEKKKVIDEMLHFLDFSGFKPKSEIVETNPRTKRSFEDDLQVLSLADDYHKIKNSIENAKFVYEMAQAMVDYLNELDIDVKTRVVQEVIKAEEETENFRQFVYVQARVTIPCDKVECDPKDGTSQICNGVIDSTDKLIPHILNTFCYKTNNERDHRDVVKEVHFEDPVLQTLAKEAVTKIESESKSPYAIKLNKIVAANTKTTSGTLTKISIIIENINCNKSVPFGLRVNCTVIEQFGSKICEVLIHEMHWLQEKKISYTCTDRPVEMKMSKSKSILTNVTVQDPKIIEMLQEAIQYLETQSNTNNKQKIVNVTSISTQIVAGFLTKLEFIVGYTNCTSENDVNCEVLGNENLRLCKAQIWDRSWIIDGKQIEVLCNELTDGQSIEKTRKRRSIDVIENQKEQNVKNMTYKQMAEESLKRFLKSSSSKNHYVVVDIEKVTVKEVSGKLILIDFTITPTNCLLQEDGNPTLNECDVVNSDDRTLCHSKILKQKWLQSNQYFVSCDNKVQKQEGKNNLVGLKENDPSDPKFHQFALESLTKYFLDKSKAKRYKIVKIEKVTTQIVSGLLTSIDFMISPKENDNYSDAIKCHTKVLEKHWLKSKDYKVNCEMKDNKNIDDVTDRYYDSLKLTQVAVECLQEYIKQNPESQLLRVTFVDKAFVKPNGKHVIDFLASHSEDDDGDTFCHAEFIEKSLVKKYVTVTCDSIGTILNKSEISEDNPNYIQFIKLAEESLQKYTESKNQSDLYTIVSIENIHVDWDKGVKTEIKFIVSPVDLDNNELKGLQCTSKIREQPWLHKKSIDITCTEDKDLYRIKRQLGGEADENPNDPTYRVLAEESLQKYLKDNGITEYHKVDAVERVTTQVVSGSMTRLEFVISNRQNLKTQKCYSKVWEQPWLDKKEITVSCTMLHQRLKRDVTLKGSQNEQNPNDPKYRALAEESLQKYLKDNAITEFLKVDRVVKVTTQVVSGSLTRIHFAISNAQNLNQQECHSKVWEQPWLNKKDITVDCALLGQRVKRQGPMPGSQTEQNPNDPTYRVLAEESLQKYLKDNAITEFLKVDKVVKVTTQVVSGSLTRIDFAISNTQNLNQQECHSEVWEQPWLNKKDITVDCALLGQRVKRQGPMLGAGENELNPNDPTYRVLAEESLQKYLKDNAITEFLKVDQVVKVKTQVVEGSLTRIDFVISNEQNLKQQECRSEVWERSWLNKKDITVDCALLGQRVKRQGPMPGSQTEQNPNDPTYRVLAEESLQKYLKDNAITEFLKVDQVVKVTTQVVSGSLTRIVFAISNAQNLNQQECHSEVWEQPWLNKKDITVDCALLGQRVKRQGPMPGSQTEQNPNDPTYRVLAEESLQKYLKDNAITEFLKVDRVVKVTTQVVSGSLTRIDFAISNAQNLNQQECHSEVWEQPWLNKKDITVDCALLGQRVKRQGPILGGETEQNPNDPTYRVLAEESLQKYLKDNAITEFLKVDRVVKVTTQVVSGSLTRIDFAISNAQNLNQQECHSKVWEQPWLNKKDITVDCALLGQRVKRQGPILGGETERNPNDPTYRVLAEESLQKYVKDNAITEFLKVDQVVKVKTQVVEGSLTRIDFVISNEQNLKQQECRSEVWERSWLNKKDITVDCALLGQRVKRQGPMLGSQTEQNPNDPTYRVLAEESLQKYLKDNAITEFLKVDQVVKVTTQVVEGSLTRIDFVISNAQNLEQQECHSEVWERSWLNKKDITVDCALLGQRAKRQGPILGGETVQNPNDPTYRVLAEESLQKYVKDNAITEFLKVDQVVKVTTQVVEGSLTRIDFVISNAQNLKQQECHSEVWERSWLNKKDITVDCALLGQRVMQGEYMMGAPTEENPNDPKYRVLAEESLQKYVKDNAITEFLKVDQVVKVTLQIVAGSLTRIDFVISNAQNLKQQECHSKVWERSWLNKKDITVDCALLGQRVKRQGPMPGSQTEQNPNDPTYRVLAEESLQKYLKDNAITEFLKVDRVVKVTTQVVSGSLTRIDFAISNAQNLNQQECHSKVWEQPWLNKKDITVDCALLGQRVKRQGPILGGETERNPNDPTYRVLAEESLQKYVKDNAITEFLKVDQVVKVTTQVVEGSLTRIDFVISNTQNLKQQECHSEVWERSWLNKKDITVDCALLGQRVKRQGPMPGSQTEQNPNDPTYRVLAEESLQKYLKDNAITEFLKVDRVVKVTTQVVSGSLTRIDFAISNAQNLNQQECHSKVWEQPWLNKKDITVDCALLGQRVKRQGPILGGETVQNPNDPTYRVLAEESLQKYVKDNAITEFLKVDQVVKVTTQVVEGSLTRIDFVISNTQNLKQQECHSEVWERSWLNKKDITVDCALLGQRVKRQGPMPGSQTEQNPNDPTYRVLAEESLQKYLKDNAITEFLKVDQVVKVTTQVVEGSLTRIDFVISNTQNLKQQECHSEVWERSWLNKKDITVDCALLGQRVKRQGPMPGSQTEQNPNDPTYRVLAEESLQKYLKDNAITEFLKVDRVVKVTTQVVSGSLTRIDYVISNAQNLNQQECHSEVWEQPWLNKKDITVDCALLGQRVKRQGPILGGETVQNPNDPTYRVLAEESLQKYLKDNAITEFLKVDQVVKVTTQVVEGSLTRIDFVISNAQNLKQQECHSEVWERSWLNKKDITVDCALLGQRVMQGEYMMGAPTEENPNDPKYRVLAEESLQKYVKDNAITEFLKVDQVVKVTLQIVAGSLTRIDFVISNAQNLKQQECHSKVWERSWLNKKDITVDCALLGQRVKRQGPMPGSQTEQNPNDPTYRVLAEESLQKYLKDNAITEFLKVDRVVKVTTQVVSGSLTRIDFAISNAQNLNQQECHSKVWEQPWLNKKDITVDCALLGQRVKRQGPILGGETERNPNDPTYRVLAEESLQKYVKDNAITEFLKVDQVVKVTTQVVEGSLTRIDFVISNTQNLKQQECHSEVWERSWLNKKDITVDCALLGQRVKRQGPMPGSQTEQNPNDPTYRVLAEESLQKYLKDNAITEFLKVDRVVKVTTQVVSGSLTRIDYVISNAQNLNQQECHSEVWEQPWLNKKDITVDCALLGQRVKRQGPILGGETVQNPNDPTYRVLAEESLQKYVKDNAITEFLKVDQVVKVTTQVVEGSLTRIDFVISNTQNLKQQECHSEVWERSWLNKKDITVDCALLGQRVKRQGPMPGSQTEQNPNDPTYRVLAEESLQKYLKDNAITEFLKVDRVVKVTTQVVSGSLTRIDYVISNAQNLNQQECHSEVWEQPWLNKKDITVDCALLGQRVKRQGPILGGETERNPNDPTYRVLAEESLQKYLKDNAITEFLKVDQVVKVTTQVVEGSLTRIDFVISNAQNLKQQECHSEVWERSWLNKKDITVDCALLGQRVMQGEYMMGAPTEENPNDPTYRVLAEESLQKYVKDNAITEFLKVDQVVKVTLQIVAGSLTRIDFVISNAQNLKQQECHSKVWERSWLNKKDITVDCALLGQRVKRQGPMPGSQTEQNPNDPTYRVLAEESLQKYLKDNAITEFLKVDRVVKVTTQVVSGSLTRIDFAISNAQNLNQQECHSKVWEQPWLNKKDITVDCALLGQRVKRQGPILGGETERNPNDPTYRVLAEESLQKYVKDNAITEFLKVDQVVKVTTQVVEGSLTRIDFVISNTQNLKQQECHSEVWERSWLNKKDITVDCALLGQRVKRQGPMPGSQTEQNPNDPTYRVLAEESLQKYLKDNAITEFLKVDQVVKVTTQVVEGSLTRIDFVISNAQNLKQQECHSEVWERSWLNKKDITVDCALLGQRVMQGEYMMGAPTEENPNDPKYRVLAEESLQKYVKDNAITEFLKVDQVVKVTLQIVAGSLTRIDFVISNAQNLKQQECHSKVWERSWLNKKDITVDCALLGQRVKRQGPMPGSQTEQNPNDPTYRVLAEESLQKYLKDNAITEFLKVDRVVKVTTQVVSGSLTRIDFAISNAQNLNQQECHSKVWEQPWLNKKDITVDCALLGQRVKRQGPILGGETERNPNDPTYRVLAEESLQKYVKDNAITEFLKVDQVVKVTTQVVEGSLTRIDFVISNTQNLKQQECHSEVWERSWLNKKDITVDCALLGQRVKRQGPMPGSQTEQNPNDPTYRVLAEESLQKYLKDNAITEFLKVDRVVKVTTQVVSGSLTRIDYVISNAQNLNQQECHSEVWEQPWLNKKDITVDCALLGQRVKRQGPILGGETVQNPNDPTYRVLAEESLQKYVKDNAITEFLKVDQVVKVTTQVVEGSLTRIDFVISNTQNLKQQECHSEVWERSWLNKKDITVDCALLGQRVKRQGPMPGSQTEQNPNDPTYRVLAEESLQKYLKDNAITEFLKVDRVVKVTTQVVSGSLTRIDYVISNAQNLNQQECHSEVWEQPWLNKKDITVDCALLGQRVKRQGPILGGETERNPNDPTYRVLAEESLQKYLKDNAITEFLKVDQVVKVTTQVVEGSLTRIDFVISNAQNLEQQECHSEVWERSWLNKKDITVDCALLGQRVKRQGPILGGETVQNPNDPTYRVLAEESLQKYVKDNAITEFLKVDQVVKVTTQVVEGSLTRIDFVISNTQNSKQQECHSEVWERSWLNKKDITVDCALLGQRVKRQGPMPGSQTEQNPNDPTYRVLAEESLQKYLKDNAITEFLKVDRVVKVTTQVVSGSLTRIDYVISNAQNLNQQECHSEVWEQPWLNKKDITVDCALLGQRVKRQGPILGGETVQNPNDPTYRVLAEESLQKYVKDNAITEFLKVDQVVKVTTQVVEGSLTRIDFVISNTQNLKQQECHSEVWERSWLNKKDITVDCALLGQRVKRQGPMPGSQTEQNPNDPTYRVLAEESLQKYLKDNAITEFLKVDRVVKVTTQVVSGSLTRIDYVISNAQNLNQQECHSEVWEQPWLNKKDITVDCALLGQRVKRQGPILGGETERNPNDPTYRVLAEESLQKYLKDNAITEFLKVDQVVKVTTQVVEGSLTRIDFVISNAQNLEQQECHSEVWERSWLNKKDITVDCALLGQRVKRQGPILGGETVQNPNDPTYRVLAEESLQKYVKDNAITEFLKVDQVVKVTTQVVEGSLTRIDFVISNTQNSKQQECHSEVWERSWLNKKDITVDCALLGQRVKRQGPMPGSQTEQNPNDPTYRVLAEESLQKYLKDNAITEFLKVDRVVKVTTQVVSGSLTRIDYVISNAQNLNQQECHSEVWEQPWLNKKDITVDCALLGQRVKRQGPILGSQTEQNPNDPTYRVLAEESLQKYVKDNAITEFLKVDQVVKVTTQVVEGSLTRIDFVISNTQNLKQQECHSEVWERSWLNKKDITVDCALLGQRVKRQGPMPGSQTEQNPNDPTYRVLAEESLQKYLKDNAITEFLKVDRVVKVTTQVVSGSLTRIDYVISNAQNLNQQECHSEVWEQPWLNKKDITVDCALLGQRVKRQGPILGGETERNPNDPTYRVLAEESLQKYLKDNAITEFLKVDQVVKVTTQVVEGSLTRIDFVISNAQNLEQQECHSEVWERSWLNKKDITVDCALLGQRVKRQGPILGGETVQNPNDPTYRVLAEESLQKYLKDNAITEFLKVDQVVKVTTQVVEGSLTRIDFVISNAQNLEQQECHSEVWERSWLNKKDITVDCALLGQRVKRQGPILGGETVQNPNDPTYRVLAEESLQKYVKDNAITEFLKVDQVVKVTTQVVEGSLTRIDFVISNTQNSKQQECHSEVWERSWLNKKDITVDCALLGQRVKRQGPMPGSQTEQNPNDPTYRVLAEESLQKYLKDNAITEFLKVDRVVKVTTQVVSGSLTRIDYVISNAQNLNQQECHSEVWEQPWLNKKDITVDCALLGQRVKRQGPILGGETVQNPNDPMYRVLAEESLQKYVKDNAITEFLKVDQVVKVTTQVVEGSLTRIDFVISNTQNLKQQECHSEVWERSWLNKKDITVDCALLGQRVKRQGPILGGETVQNPNDPTYRVLAEESLQKYVKDNAITEFLKVDQVVKVTTQVVEGSLTRIDFVISNTQNLKQQECHSEVWERSWLNKKDITVDCALLGQRVKRQGPMPGSQTEQNPNDPTYRVLAEESLQKYLKDNAITEFLKVDRVVKVTTQVVSGSLTRIDYVISNAQNLNQQECHSEVWEQPWLNKKDITVDCALLGQRVKRQGPILGGETVQNPNDPTYRVLAEESLQKYVKDNAITEFLKVDQVVKVTTQVVEGSLTRIDFVISNTQNLKQQECHSEVWERSWLNKKDITVDCALLGQRVKRQGPMPGSQTEQNPNDPTYRVLAEESLQKYLKDNAITEFLKVDRVVKVTTQVVSGSLTRIDYVISNAQNLNQQECHSEVWEQPWLNKKDITVDCALLGQRVKRQGPILGGETVQNPNDPTYRVLAEESLQKYLKDNAITEFLKVDRVVKVTTQVVSGSLTRIDFVISNAQNLNLQECHSEVWDQPWINYRKITSTCAKKNRRRKRSTGDNEISESLATGKSIKHFRGHSEEEQDMNKEEYKLLAEESLRRYQIKNSTFHKVLKVERVVTRVVSGIKYKIDFTAAPTSCTADVSKLHLHKCKVVEGVTLYCHSEIWDRPWLKKKTIDVQCHGSNENDFDEYELGALDDISKPTPEVNSNNNKFKLLAEEATEKYLTASNRKYVYEVTRINSVSEHLADGNIIKLEFSISPTTCLRSAARSSNETCKFKLPMSVMHCIAKIWDRPWLHVNKDIKITCKQLSKIEKVKRDLGHRNVRQAGDEDDLDEDTTYYYADRAVQHVNDQSNSNNLHKLVTIHAVQNSLQMNTQMISMYIELAETYCLRHHVDVNLHDCEEMNGLDHKLCLARLWPSPDDELVIRHVSVTCDTDEDFISVTGLKVPELLKLSIEGIEKSPDNHFKLIHQGEPQVIPTLDSKLPIKLNFIIATTNCSKNIDLDKNPFQCFIDNTIPAKACHSFIWMEADTRTIIGIDAKCPRPARSRRSPFGSANVTAGNTEIQNLVTESLEKLEMSSLHRYKQRVLQINSHSTKITTGKVTTIDFDVGYTSCLKYEWVENVTSCDFLEHLPRRRCVAQIFERLWIHNGRNIDVNCVDDETPLESHIEFESAEMANQLAKEALKHIEAKYPHPKKQKIVRIFSLEKQVVAGLHYRMKVEVGFTDCVALSEQTDCKLENDLGLNKFCRVNVWVRPWTDHPPNFRVSCDYQEGATHELYHHVQAEHLFYNFLTTHSPSYVNDYSEMQKRFEIFKANVKKIHELNIYEKGTATYGVTRFTDLTYEEFSSRYMGLKTDLRDANQLPTKKAEIPNIKIPENFDWREYDAVTDVKDQGSCGSCWAFSVTGNIEGQWKMQSGQLVSLSEQELVDCDKLDNGCNGGLPDNAYRAIEQLGGLELEQDYPYEGEDDKCVFNKTLAKVQISGAVNITSNETGMAQWLVHNGPISIGINANAMQFYMGGISHPWKMLCNPTNLDHGVLVVGYGVKDYPLFNKRLPYWIVKNSWGKSWGEQGYYRVYRGDGTCGVNQMASSAVI